MSNRPEINSISPSCPPKRIDFRDDARHLILRPIEIEDTEKTYAAIQATFHELRRYMVWMHLFELDYQTHIKQMASFKQDYLSGKDFMFGLFDGRTDEFIMVANLMPRKDYLNTSIVELGFWTSKPHFNCGYATLASKILVITAFEAFGYHRIQVTCNKSNPASKRAIEKCGFQYEGTKRNHLLPPTPQMIMDGYTTERDTLFYALVKEDIPELTWYNEILEKLSFTPYSGEPFTLKQ